MAASVPGAHYDPLLQFTPVGMIATGSLVWAVNTALPASSMQELIALARRQPGMLNDGSAGAPPAIANGLNAASNQVVALPEVLARFKVDAVEAAPGSPALLGHCIEADYRAWHNVVKMQNLKIGHLRVCGLQRQAREARPAPGGPTLYAKRQAWGGYSQLERNHPDWQP